MAASTSVSFLSQNRFLGSSQNLLSVSICPKFVGTVPMMQRPRRQCLFAVEAQTKTRREDRLARHSRIRKKVSSGSRTLLCALVFSWCPCPSSRWSSALVRALVGLGSFCFWGRARCGSMASLCSKSIGTLRAFVGFVRFRLGWGVVLRMRALRVCYCGLESGCDSSEIALSNCTWCFVCQFCEWHIGLLNWEKETEEKRKMHLVHPPLIFLTKFFFLRLTINMVIWIFCSA